MVWNYAVGQNVLGPFTDDQITRLIQSGEIRPGTLVWNPELPGWIEARASTLASHFAAPPSVPSLSPSAAALSIPSLVAPPPQAAPPAPSIDKQVGAWTAKHPAGTALLMCAPAIVVLALWGAWSILGIATANSGQKWVGRPAVAAMDEMGGQTIDATGPYIFRDVEGRLVTLTVDNNYVVQQCTIGPSGSAASFRQSQGSYTGNR
jgi:hypothetical protein